MEPQDIENLSSFFEELQRETDRGLPLVSTALIDEKLLETLSAFLCKGASSDDLLNKPNAPLGTFSARIDACFALGLIDEHEFREISLLRKIRNLFAHSKHGLSFSERRVVGLCTSLTSELPPGTTNPSARYRFTNSVVCLTLRLYYRDKWVASEKRQPKVWVKPEDIRWRSFDAGQPPEAAQYVTLSKSGARIFDKKT